MAVITAPLLPYLNGDLLAAALPACRNPDAWADPLRAACLRYNITSKRRLAAFLAQIGHESGDLNRLSESLDYSPEGLLDTWPMRFTAPLAYQLGRTAQHPANQPEIAEVAYGRRMGNTRQGEAWIYRGAGLLQTTGKNNHAAAAKLFDLQLAQVPSWLRTAPGAALSAAFYWAASGCNALADLEQTDAITTAINGGQHGAADRRRRFAAIRKLLPG